MSRIHARHLQPLCLGPLQKIVTPVESSRARAWFSATDGEAAQVPFTIRNPEED